MKVFVMNVLNETQEQMQSTGDKNVRECLKSNNVPEEERKRKKEIY